VEILIPDADVHERKLDDGHVMVARLKELDRDGELR
jgi:hypothetical protein